MRHPANVAVGVATHTGRVRSGNEDDFLLCAPQNAEETETRGWFLAIADGMGGATGGAEASRTAVRAAVGPYLDAGSRDGGGDAMARMRAGFAEAVRQVYELSLENPNLRGMGTTLTIVNLLGERIVLGHVGDTRCVRIRGGHFEQLSEDHAVREPESYLTRCVGAGQQEVDVDVAEHAVRDDDRFVLMTDGLWSVVPEDEITQIVRALPSQAAAEELVRSANRNGGPDNSTAIVVHVVSTVDGDGVAEVELPAEEVREPALVWESERGLMPARWPRALLVVGVLLMGVGVTKVVYQVDPLGWFWQLIGW